MKCKKCGQELIDKKEFCTNCGSRLNVVKHRGITLKTLLIIMFVFILFGTGLVLSIMYVGTEKELNDIFNKPNNDNLSDYYGTYKLVDVKVTVNTPSFIADNKDMFLGFNLVFSDNLFKVSLYNTLYTTFNDQKLYSDSDLEKYGVFDIGNVRSYFYKDSDFNVLFGDSLYVYYQSTLFVYERSNGLSGNYVNKKLPSLYGNEVIDGFISAIDNEFSALDMSNSNKVIYYHYKLYTYNNVESILVVKEFGSVGSVRTSYSLITYDVVSKVVVGLGDYLSSIGKSIDDFKDRYGIGSDSLYYVDGGLVYVLVNDRFVLLEF